MTDDNSSKRTRSWHSRSRMNRFIEGTANREDGYARRQREAIEEFRQLARYSFVHNNVTCCYPTLEEAQTYQIQHNIQEPIWDAVAQQIVE